MKKTNKRLSISRETMRNLKPAEMSGVVGGAASVLGCTIACTYTCNTCQCPQSTMCISIGNTCWNTGTSNDSGTTGPSH